MFQTYRNPFARLPALVLLLLTESTLVGCGDSHTKAPPPFEMGKTTVVSEGEPSKQHKAPFTIAITSPSKEERLKRATVVEVTCTLVVPPGGAMPRSIDLELLDRKNRVLDTGEFAPKSDLGDGRYTLVRSVKLPDRAGVYTLQATAIDTVVLDSDKPSNSTIDPISSRITTSEPVEVRAQ